MDCWKQTMTAELKALDDNHTWSIMDLPHGKVPIGCRWLHKIKYRVGGSIE